MNSRDRAQLLLDQLKELGAEDVVGNAQLSYVCAAILGTPPENVDGQEPGAGVDLDELAWTFESLGIDQFRQGADDSFISSIFEWAFRIRTGMLAERPRPSIRELWLLIASGLASQNHPQLRDVLAERYWELTVSGNETEDWPDSVLRAASRALFYLTRKKGGWADIEEALSSLNELARLQRIREPDALEASNKERADRQVMRLLGLYHLAEGLSVVGQYLRTGNPDSVLATAERHAEHSRELLAAVGDFDLEQIGAAASVILPSLVRGSIWFNTSRLSESARHFARGLAQREDSPVLELWWSQRQALGGSILDPFKVAVGVQLPTSAGKTLLAEFAIVQALALNPSSSVVYVVPTRALVNQISRRLRRDLSSARMDGRAITVEIAVPVFELDPTENRMLSSRPDILVTTPEKLDLLVRSGHPSVSDLSLVVVDEAHHISDPDRGPRLELLLATIKRERGATTRFLLLTPFMPNADQLARWLGDEAFASISIDWRPSVQVRAVGRWTRRKGEYIDSLTLVPSVSQPSSWADVTIELGRSHLQPSSRSRPAMSVSIAESLARRGATSLILTRGPSYAEKRALSAAGVRRKRNAGRIHDPLLADAIEYVAAELGREYPLVATLPYGIAFHHAGVPPEVRSLIETLLERGSLSIVSGTTTLAQGVDFPLSSVIVETLSVPQGRGRGDRTLLHSEFWNIVGRAGRALRDRVGLVVKPCLDSREVEEFKAYLQSEASAVVSALLESLVAVDDSVQRYDLALVRRNPSLSYFLQYLTHALRIAGYTRATAEVEEILRSSLVFHSLRRDDRSAAERLISWSRGFLAATRDRRLVEVADVTGLSLPSVGLLAASATREMRSPEYWLPDNLFGESLGPLTELVELLSGVPEMKLGLTNESGAFSAARVAAILHGWVNGLSVPELAERYFPSDDKSRAIREVGRYMFREMTGQLPWGLGALELVATSGRKPSDSPDAGRVPAMTYYGVRTRSAVALRMIGVPRIGAEVLGQGAPEFDSFAAARQWVEDRPPRSWDAAGETRGLRGAVLRNVWRHITTG